MGLALSCPSVLWELTILGQQFDQTETREGYSKKRPKDWDSYGGIYWFSLHPMYWSTQMEALTKHYHPWGNLFTKWLFSIGL